ncbi:MULTISPECIES: GNAT family N-acetyltransferase [Bacillaceae]|uniref:GNAT family N-acetyltransferase n=1 Tax=Evansella alkalicola TaxID=745819 RepID=A0ABS6JUA3_9BACI|nr:MULTISPECIES: GNAT family N-acetyltransferase [Bacillaceae]MBU9722073.1 GNAT family N-acetyltransferase [Bacillus alkalicola]
MIKKRDLQECQVLYELMVHPDVFPFVRQKAYSYDEFIFLTKQTLEAEEQGKLISRTILDEWGLPIGTINLFDIHENTGFIGTWIGKPYHGKGYNKIAKELFLHELFFELGIEQVYMRIRKENTRSIKAALKMPYVNVVLNKTELLSRLNSDVDSFEVFEISKALYTMHTLRIEPVSNLDDQLKEA